MKAWQGQPPTPPPLLLWQRPQPSHDSMAPHPHGTMAPQPTPGPAPCGQGLTWLRPWVVMGSRMWGTGHSTPGTPQHPQTLPPTHAQEAAWLPAGADTVDAGGAVQSGGWRPPCPLPTLGGPSVGPDASCLQPTPRPVVLSDGCGWETPCRGGAAPSTQRWRQAGDEDVTRHPSAGTVLRHRCDGGVGREANTVLLAPGWDAHSPQAPAPHYPITHIAGTRPPACMASSLVSACGHTLWTWQCRHLGREQS